MWLDRFSNQPAPSGSPSGAQSRSYSPAPRRSMHLAPGPQIRPGYSPRSSSLSLVSRSNTSTTSLQGGGKISNGSTLKQELTASEDVDDSLEVLKRVIGPSLSKKPPGSNGTRAETSIEKPEALDGDIAFDGLSLHDFVQPSPEGAQEQYHGKGHSHFNVQSAEECEYVILQDQGLRSLLTDLNSR